MKPVREAANEALISLKEVPGEIETSEEQDAKLSLKNTGEEKKQSARGRKPRFVDNSDHRDAKTRSLERKGQDEGLAEVIRVEEEGERKLSLAT
eukprot:CAMPEP_0202963994 /NCGR_PEP_ID=MMETSP1396-20130829/8062_1 /ASSEMBLY_ACC=CAM_ASM_000872 /TAXON_ID= /ORGANISM="Pseudokeronopsis sp., Strain Brazil" /LENGTH=93 /DNA_ID=CAMNT_0049685731 /DNA_START=244 /DNA_END=525 /DNA_ORIENTATION=-